jgi:hypothetical protein
MANGEGTTTRHRATPCSGCKESLDAGDGYDGEVPSEGDLSVCAYCGAFHVFTEGLGLRALPEAELAALPPEIRQQLEEGRDLLRAARMGIRRGGSA